MAPPKNPRPVGPKSEKLGRPSIFTPDIAETICNRIAEGESLRSVCRDATMPSKSTVMKWLGENEEFSDQYARAREAQADHFADEIIEIADDATNDFMVRERQDGSTEEVLNTEHVQRSRLRVDARKWLAARMAPKKYGDKITQEFTGTGTPLIPVLNVTIAGEPEPEPPGEGS